MILESLTFRNMVTKSVVITSEGGEGLGEDSGGHGYQGRGQMPMLF